MPGTIQGLRCAFGAGFAVRFVIHTSAEAFAFAGGQRSHLRRRQILPDYGRSNTLGGFGTSLGGAQRHQHGKRQNAASANGDTHSVCLEVAQ